MTNLTGATFLASQFRTMIADAKAKLAQAGEDMTAAVADLHEVSDQAVAQVKIVQAETSDLKAALGLGSNGGPALDSVEPKNKTVLPKIEYETPAPFNGPARPPLPHDDMGNVKQLKLGNGETLSKIGFM